MSSNNIHRGIIFSIFAHACMLTLIYTATITNEDKKIKTVYMSTASFVSAQPSEELKKETFTEQLKPSPSPRKYVDTNKPIQKPQTVEPKPAEQAQKEMTTSSLNLQPQTEEATVRPKTEEIDYSKVNADKIRDAIAKYKKYPPSAVKMGMEGVCIVSFRLKTSGDADEIKMVKSSGYTLLDKSTIQTIENASQDMPRPTKSVILTIPIEYKLN